jgi:hypothetical protein
VYYYGRKVEGASPLVFYTSLQWIIFLFCNK